MEESDAPSLADQPDQKAAALTSEEVPKLWIECSLDKDVQAKYDIMQQIACKSTDGQNPYNRSISLVLYEYLQKNEPGKESRLVENFNEWYLKTAEKLQKAEKDEKKDCLKKASIEYIKPITEEIEGKFPNACAYAQHLFTHARYMLHSFLSTEYRRQIDGVVYGFTTYGNRCLTYAAYPIDKERTYENSTRIPLDGKLDLYALKCIEGLPMDYNGGIYRLNINGTVQEKYPGEKKVLYELEKDKLNFKSICEIK